MTHLLAFIRANSADLQLFFLAPAIALLAIFGGMNGNATPEQWAIVWEALLWA